MKVFKNKYVMIGLAFAGGILLHSVIKKFTSKETTLESLNEPLEPLSDNIVTPTTPVSGTSDNILNQIDSLKAEEIKNELK